MKNTSFFVCVFMYTICFNLFSVQAQQWPENIPNDSEEMVVSNYRENCQSAFHVDSFGIAVGEILPSNISLFGVEGTQYDINQFCGPSIFIPTNVTCPGTRVYSRMIADINEYLPEFNVFLVNTIEMHPETGPSPCSQVVGDSFPSQINIPNYLFSQINTYGEQVSRIEYFRNSMNIPNNFTSLLDGPESPFLDLWGGPFGGFVTDSCGKILYEFPTTMDTVWEKENLITFISNVSIGIKEEHENVMNIFPNPTNDMLTIENTNQGEIVVVDCFGKVIREIIVENKKESIVLNVSDMSDGMYYLKNKNSYQKFVKN